MKMNPGDKVLCVDGRGTELYKGRIYIIHNMYLDRMLQREMVVLKKLTEKSYYSY